MSIELEYLDEPTLQFGAYFEHQDSKTGLAEFGPFGKNKAGLHPAAIKLGFVGTRETIAKAKAWVAECGQPIESPKLTRRSVQGGADWGPMFGEGGEVPEVLTRAEKILRPNFVGFNKESAFECEFQVNERWDRPLQPRELDVILALPNVQQRILRIVELFSSHIEGLAVNSPVPDIIVLALTQAITEKASTAQVKGRFYLDLRRALKAAAMKWGIPIQILTHRTLEGKSGDLQDPATRAWNFCTAQYYKAQGIPWRPTAIDDLTCFVGISFYVAQEEDDGSLTLRSSVAQAFDYLGQGLVLRGDPFEWSQEKHGPAPHLTKEAARMLIANTLREYVKVQGVPPRRVVVHKTSEFWGPEHGEHNELDGFYEGIDSVYPNLEIDLLALRQTGVKLFREGDYPPLRGTYMCLEDKHHFLFTMGYIPYLQTYPGSYVPEPWQITDHSGGTAPRDLLLEVLALTKMNVNNCAFADGTPITLLFSHRIGDIMKHIPEGESVHPHYRFYM